VDCLDELSGHADSGELLQWMKPMAATLRRVFLVHGEAEQAGALAGEIRLEYGIETEIAAPERQFELVL
jgi:metallo-beta-lactamase family protein